VLYIHEHGHVDKLEDVQVHVHVHRHMHGHVHEHKYTKKSPVVFTYGTFSASVLINLRYRTQ
jgi:hypothetical protein